MAQTNIYSSTLPTMSGEPRDRQRERGNEEDKFLIGSCSSVHWPTTIHYVWLSPQQYWVLSLTPWPLYLYCSSVSLSVPFCSLLHACRSLRFTSWTLHLSKHVSRSSCCFSGIYVLKLCPEFLGWFQSLNPSSVLNFQDSLNLKCPDLLWFHVRNL